MIVVCRGRVYCIAGRALDSKYLDRGNRLPAPPRKILFPPDLRQESSSKSVPLLLLTPTTLEEESRAEPRLTRTEFLMAVKVFMYETDVSRTFKPQQAHHYAARELRATLVATPCLR